MLLVYRARSATILCQKIPESESHKSRCSCVTILGVFYCNGFETEALVDRLDDTLAQVKAETLYTGACRFRGN